MEDAGMIGSLVIVLALAVLGDAISGLLALPIPGSAIGMMLLASVFVARGGADAGSARLFDLASPHFPLFFIPAAVGVVASRELLAAAWLQVAVAIVVGTLVTIAVTGLLSQHLLNRLVETRTA
jgi:holin-like protein